MKVRRFEASARHVSPRSPVARFMRAHSVQKRINDEFASPFSLLGIDSV